MTNPREEFFNGKFSKGQIVKDDNGLYEILDIGANYLTVINNSNKISKKWPDKITETKESLVVDYFKSENENMINLRSRFIESLYEYNLGKFDDKLGLITAWNKLDEFFINNNTENIIKVSDIFKKINQLDKFKDILEMYQNNTTVSKEDQLEAAKIFSSIFSEDINLEDTPENIVNGIISKYELSESVIEILKSLKEDFKINFDETLIEKREEQFTADYVLDKNGNKTRARKIVFKEDKDPVDHLDPNPNYSDHEQIDDHGIDFSQKADDELNNMSDDEIDNIINTHLSEDDFFEDYPEDQLCIFDCDTNSPLVPEVNEEMLTEVLSRMERLRSSIRFHRTESKRERRLKIALMKKSDTKTITKRARRLAVKALELRIARKPLNTLTVAEKERIEARIAKAKPILNRMTVRLISKVKKLEQQRLHEGF